MKLDYLELFVGGFSGPSSSAKFDVEDQVVNIRYALHKEGRVFKFDNNLDAAFFDEDIKFKTLSKDISNQFKKDIEEIKINSWNSEYLNSNILDGTQWEVKLKYKHRRLIEISGSNEFPDQWDWFIKIINKYIGEDVF